MYFKQIEMTGFKTFADRTFVNLAPGVTAIVGPNGCGKSNILDAIRWSLGEQSAKSLRGSHMQDVIFNGSEERSPTGMAEVSLTFDNADAQLPLDFAEVQISRRVYRSGESEYLINKAPCRLRDIQELFMDTGIGTNAYSLIGQGKIDLVLSSKPEDRRFLFEEAAGIIKYKSRKRIALRKLDSAENNLLRLGDIIAEIERQLRSLKRQVNAAIRYRELSDRLREIEIRAAWMKYNELSSSIDATRTQFQTAQEQYEALNAETSKKEARVEELGLAKLEVDRVLHSRREGVHELEGEMEKIERQIALIRQQIAFGKEQREQAATQKESLLHRAAIILQTKEEAGGRARKIRRELSALDENVAEKERELESANDRAIAMEQQLEELRNRALEQVNLRAKKHTDIEKVTIAITSIETHLNDLYERQQAEERANREHLSALEAARARDRELADGIARCAAEELEYDNRISELDAEIQGLNAQWQSLRERKSSTEARLGSLRELRDSYEGFGGGVRAIMEAKRNGEAGFEGVIGPVADLLSTEIANEKAIEAALGVDANSVIVHNRETVERCLAFLNASESGRVTFLPLDGLRKAGGAADGSLASSPGVIGTAKSCVQFDEQITPAVDLLLEGTLVVDTFEIARQIAETDPQSSLVTLAGERIAPNGAVTGGRGDAEGRGIIGRSAEIGELEAALEEINGEIDRCKAETERIAGRIAEDRAHREDVKRKAAELQKSASDVGSAIARHTGEIERLAQSRSTIERERDNQSQKRGEFENERNLLLQQATEIESNEERLQRELAESQDAAASARRQVSVHSGQLSDHRVQAAALRQQAEEAERDVERLAREHEDALEDSARRDELVRQLEENERKLEDEIEGNVERTKALSESKEEARKKVIESENQRQALLDESETLEKALRELREKARAAQSEVHQLELNLRHDEDQRNFFEERILDEYHLALASLKEEDVGADEMSADEREELVVEIRDKLQRMGQVNLGAIDEYEDLQKRHEFLTTQSTDLSDARDALRRVVDRIDETIKAMFLETFTQVAEYFRENFRRLFNGGQARIYLLDEEDPLECGIEIEARPPGKKPQTISLLSGGEQAMTAIALLFGIFKAKPSPFCVLDEVDAPLDDANIGRFLHLLDEFTNQSQFIIITHNKRTMSRADVLYGVTMQERGVSKLVSVRFDEVRDSETAA